MKRKYLISLILIVGMFAGIFTPTTAYTSTITATGFVIGIDVYHGGYHANAADLAPLIGNLTAAGNTVVIINETWFLWDNMSALILTQPDNNFTAAEKTDINNWLNLGYKLLIAGGDSDYGGYYDPYPINDLLAAIGTITRIAAVSISDPVYNDGASYRVAATEIWEPDRPGIGYVTANVTKGVDAGVILHGPTAIMAFDGYYYKDLRGSTFPEVVEPIMLYSENASASNGDASNFTLVPNIGGDWDLYDGEVGDFPAITYENLKHALPDSGNRGNTSHLILAGECFWTHYKNMYDQTTESGVYNGGLHYGQMLMNNIFNYLLEQPPEPTETSFSYALVPLAIITTMYVIVRRRK